MSYDATKDNKNDMGKYTTDPLRTGREIEKAGGVFDHLVEPLLDQDYILDMDPTVKPLYGHQEG